MTAPSFAAWLTGESSTVEFKKSTAGKDRSCRTLYAFANDKEPR